VLKTFCFPSAPASVIPGGLLLAECMILLLRDRLLSPLLFEPMDEFTLICVGSAASGTVPSSLKGL